MHWIHKDCLFHLTKDSFRKGKEIGLSKTYIDDNFFKINIRMIIPISFVSNEDTIQVFKELAIYP